MNKLERLIKKNQIFFQNLKDGKKNFLGETMRAVMCKTCTNVLGKDVFQMRNGICETCRTPQATPYRDETERIIAQNMGMGRTREAYIERHRAQKAEFLRKHPVVHKNPYL